MKTPGLTEKIMKMDKEQKKIMILGASVYQVPLIKTARRMGLYTIVSSIPRAYPGFSDADKIYHINTTDKEAILKVCREEGVCGICTSGTDVQWPWLSFRMRPDVPDPSTHLWMLIRLPQGQLPLCLTASAILPWNA